MNAHIIAYHYWNWVNNDRVASFYAYMELVHGIKRADARTLLALD